MNQSELIEKVAQATQLNQVAAGLASILSISAACIARTSRNVVP